MSDILYNIEFLCESEMRKGTYRVNGIRPEKVRLKDGTFICWQEFLADNDGFLLKNGLMVDQEVKKEYHTPEKDNNFRTDYEIYTVAFTNTDSMPFGILWARWENYIAFNGQPAGGKKTLTHLTTVYCEDGKIKEMVQ